MTQFSHKKFPCIPLGPSRITAKMAFLPPKLTYDLIEKTSEESQSSSDQDQKSPKSYEFAYSAEYIGVDEKYITDYFEVFYTKTKRKNNIACLHIKCSKKNDSKYTILFSHGNAADLGMLTGFYLRIVNLLNVNLFSYDYSGYGKSSGRASEKNLYADIEAAYNILLEKYNLKPENVILYGQSIGTAPTVDLATKIEPAGVVLHSPLMSGIRLLFPVKRTWICDAFPIIDKIVKIKSPTLVIHGTSDEIINFSHGLQIYEHLENPVEPLW
jgi:abhydrolase domain-containing protein 17